MASPNSNSQSSQSIHSNNADQLLGINSHGPVVGTYSIVDFNLGIHGGGPLFADGTFGGNVTVNFSSPIPTVNKGELIFQLQPTTWSYINSIPQFGGHPGIEVNYDVKAIKGTPPPSGTFTDLAPITGTPERIDLPPLNTVGHPDLLIRVTLNPNFASSLGL